MTLDWLVASATSEKNQTEQVPDVLSELENFVEHLVNVRMASEESTPQLLDLTFEENVDPMSPTGAHMSVDDGIPCMMPTDSGVPAQPPPQMGSQADSQGGGSQLSQMSWQDAVAADFDRVRHLRV